MIITIPYAKEQFSRFNEMCFGGSLPEVPIVLTRARTFLGRMCYKKVGSRWNRKNCDFMMRLSVLFDLPEEEWQDVIIHEMIHLNIAYKGLKDSSSHGYLFQSIMFDINDRFGRHLTVKYKLQTGKGMILPDNKRRTHYVCISTFNNGSKGITVCSEAMARKIDLGLPRCYNLKKREWYITNDVYFNGFRHSRLPCIYKVKSPEELARHLENAEKWCEK